MKKNDFPGFYLPNQNSPTFFNLSQFLQKYGWVSVASAESAFFSEENLNFDEKAAQCLEYKHLLTDLIIAYCPEVMPLTYCINDLNWRQVLSKLVENQSQNWVWILKPSLLNNGQAIKIFSALSSLENHFHSANRMGGEHVLQQYIINPHLLRDNRKYSIRQFVVLTNYTGAFLYRDGYFNVALHPYNEDFTNLAPHLTNEHLYGDEVNVIQIPGNRFESYPYLFDQIKGILKRVINGLQIRFPQAFERQTKKSFALFGFDFMVDNTGRVWLLEANHGPCFPVSDAHPLQAYLYREFWENIITNFVLSIAHNQRTQPEPAIFHSLLSFDR